MKVDMSVVQETVRVQEPQKCLGKNRLAGTGFTDDGKTLSLVDIQADASDRVQGFAAQMEFDVQIFYR